MALDMKKTEVMEAKMEQIVQVNEKHTGTTIQIETDDSEVTSDVQKSDSSATRAIFLVLSFNMLLIVAGIPVYLFFRSENEPLKQSVLDFLIVGGALVAIPFLYCLGDLSEGRPNFYYI